VETERDCQALLIFDNREHVIDACALVAETILRNCSGTSILATTREALGGSASGSMASRWRSSSPQSA
jgi:predicted ATPase